MKTKTKLLIAFACICSFAVFAAVKTTFYGPVDMQNNRIMNLGSATADTDAVTKGYVKGTFLPIQGTSASSHQHMEGSIHMGGYKITHIGAPTNSTDASTKGYVDTLLQSYLPLSGGILSGPVSMGGQKITNLQAPTAAADAVTKAYADTLVNSKLPVVDSFMFYKLNGGQTNEARIFNVNSTGSYINVSMLADNPKNTITAEPSNDNDTVTVVRNSLTMKAGSGFKLWVSSSETNDHYTSILVRDGSAGASVALVKVKYIDTGDPDWKLYVTSTTSVPEENKFTYLYNGAAMYSIQKAWYSGMFMFAAGISNVTSRTITCGIEAYAKGFAVPSVEYSISYIGSTTQTIPAHSCSWINIYIPNNEYTDAQGAQFTIYVINHDVPKREYKTFWSGDLP
ncbi:hypothetical protein J6U78_03870 [bacterium]|nr:hypothetical protein [bacterium]